MINSKIVLLFCVAVSMYLYSADGQLIEDLLDDVAGLLNPDPRAAQYHPYIKLLCPADPRSADARCKRRVNENAYALQPIDGNFCARNITCHYNGQNVMLRTTPPNATPCNNDDPDYACYTRRCLPPRTSEQVIGDCSSSSTGDVGY